MRRWLAAGTLAVVGAVAGWIIAIAWALCTVDADSAARSYCEVIVFAWAWPRGIALTTFIVIGAAAGFLAGIFLLRRSRRPA
jgi:hypothetical protein